MRKIYLIMGTMMSFLAGNLAAQNCTPVFSSPCSSDDIIDLVQFNTLNNSASGCNGGANNYLLDTVNTTSVMIGANYTLSVQAGASWPEGIGVFVDYNGDGDFADAGEFVYNTPTASSNLETTTVTIPGSATPGVRLMRVMCIYNTVITLADTCASATYGETEDYWITVTPGAAVDAALAGYSSPMSGCGLTATENITVDVQNWGTNDFDSIQVSYTINGGTTVSEMYVGTLSQGATAAFTFAATADLTGTGPFNIAAWVALPTDSIGANDTIWWTVLGPINALPYCEDFESMTIGDMTQLQTDDFDWTVNTGGTTSSATGPSSDHTTGTGYYIYLETSTPNYPNKVASIESFCIDISGAQNPYLSFWYHMYGVSTGTLNLEIYDGANWNTVWSQSGDHGDMWYLGLINLSAYSGVIKYRFTGNSTDSFTSDIALDDICVYDSDPFDDVAALNVEWPTGVICDAGMEDVTGIFTNNGTGPVAGFNLYYDLNGADTVMNAFTDTLWPGDSLVWTFDVPADLSTSGANWIGIWSDLSTDSITSNDYYSGVVINGFPDVDAGADTTICAWDSYVLGGAPTSMVGWYFNWSPGAGLDDPTAMNPMAVVGSTTTYTVWVEDQFGCMNSDSITITTLDLPEINLMADTSVCLGDTLTLDAGPNGIAYLWSTGESTQTIDVDSTDWYGVGIVGANGCTNTDTVYVLVIDSLVIDLGLDVQGCDTVLISANLPGADSYLWNTGETTEEIWVTTTGTYYVDVVKCGSASDTIDVTIDTTPVVSLGTDTTYCEGTFFMYTMDAGAGAGNTYFWYDATTSQTNTVNGPGLYNVWVTSAAGCIGYDEIEIIEDPMAIVDLGGDVTVCDGDSVWFDAGAGFDSYLWSTGETTEGIAAGTAGTYSVTVTPFGTGTCPDASDAADIIIVAGPAIDLGADYQICTGSTTDLDAGADYASYWWNDGSTGQTLTVSTSGTYWVEVEDTATGCYSTDAINITMGDAVVDLGTDTTICAGDTLTLNAGTATSYLWSDGSTAQTLNVADAGTYTIDIVDGNGCSGSDAITIAIDDSCINSVGTIIANVEFTMYPNPSHGNVTLNISSSKNTTMTMEVLTIEGQLIQTNTFAVSAGSTVKSFNLTELASGVYVVAISKDGERSMNRLIIE